MQGCCRNRGCALKLTTILLYSQDAEANAVKSDHDSPNHTLESVKADTSSRPSSGKNSKTGSLDRDRKKSKNASLGKNHTLESVKADSSSRPSSGEEQ